MSGKYLSCPGIILNKRSSTTSWPTKFVMRVDNVYPPRCWVAFFSSCRRKPGRQCYAGNSGFSKPINTIFIPRFGLCSVKFGRHFALWVAIRNKCLPWRTSHKYETYSPINGTSGVPCVLLSPLPSRGYFLKTSTLA